MIGLLVLNILSYFVVIALSAMVHPGWLVLLIPAIWVSVGFRQVGEEERAVVEFFQKFYKVLGPGLQWIFLPFQKVRAFVLTPIQQISLFTEENIEIDFKDGSATPRRVVAHVRVCSPEHAYKDIRGKTYSGAYRQTYEVADWQDVAKNILESLVRAYLNMLSLEEGLTMKGSGIDLKTEIENLMWKESKSRTDLEDRVKVLTGQFDKADTEARAGLLQQIQGLNLELLENKERKKLEDELSHIGVELIQIVIGDFDLPEALIEARGSVQVAEQRRKAAMNNAEAVNQETAGPILNALKSLKDLKDNGVDVPDSLMEYLMQRFDLKLSGELGKVVHYKGLPNDGDLMGAAAIVSEAINRDKAGGENG